MSELITQDAADPLRVTLRTLPAPDRTEAVFDLYRELFGEGEVAVVRSVFEGREQAFSRDWIACADLGNGVLGGSAMGSQSLECPTLGALNGVGVRPEARRLRFAALLGVQTLARQSP